MVESENTFEGTFEDEESSDSFAFEDEESGSFATTSGEESDSVEESDEEEVPMSVSGLPFDQKVEMFNKSASGKKSKSESESESESESGSEDGFGDEESDSENESDYSGEDDSSEEGSSLSDSEGSSYDEKDGRVSFMNEQERLRGMGRISSSNLRTKWYVIGLAIFCVILLALAIGLGVGLSKRKNKNDDEDNAPASVPTLPDGTAPTSPPVRMPVKLPNPPKINPPPEIEDVRVSVEASGGLTIFRDGEEAEIELQEGTMLVQGGVAFSLIELPVTMEEIEEVEYLLYDDSRTATFCLEHVPNEDNEDVDPDRIVTYSACLLQDNSDSDEGVDLLAEVNYMIPDDCIWNQKVDFDVSPDDKTICMDVTEMVFDLLPVARGRRVLEDAKDDLTQKLVMMIDSFEQSDEPGDQFYTKDNEAEVDAPSLTIEGTEIAECQTVTDFICTDSKFTLVCNQLKATGLDHYLGDTRLEFTVFAPTDDAILALPSNVDLTHDVLAYHAAEGLIITSSMIDCSQEEILPLFMANFQTTTFKCDSPDLFIVGLSNTDDALPKIIEADIETCNGIVHVVDQVLLPESYGSSGGALCGCEDGTNFCNYDFGDTGDCEACSEVPSVQDCYEQGLSDEGAADCEQRCFASSSPSKDDNEDDIECLTIEERMCSIDNLEAMCTLYGLLKDDPLVSEIFEVANTQETTLFLPSNNAAFLPTSMDIDPKLIANMLWNHVVSGYITAYDLVCDEELTMEGGDSTKTICDGDNIFQVGDFNVEEDMPMIIMSDIEYCSGVIHVVTRVIVTEELDLAV